MRMKSKTILKSPGQLGRCHPTSNDQNKAHAMIRRRAWRCVRPVLREPDCKALRQLERIDLRELREIVEEASNGLDHEANAGESGQKTPVEERRDRIHRQRQLNSDRWGLIIAGGRVASRNFVTGCLTWDVTRLRDRGCPYFLVASEDTCESLPQGAAKLFHPSGNILHEATASLGNILSEAMRGNSPTHMAALHGRPLRPDSARSPSCSENRDLATLQRSLKADIRKLKSCFNAVALGEAMALMQANLSRVPVMAQPKLPPRSPILRCRPSTRVQRQGLRCWWRRGHIIDKCRRRTQNQSTYDERSAQLL